MLGEALQEDAGALSGRGTCAAKTRLLGANTSVCGVTMSEEYARFGRPCEKDTLVWGDYSRRH